MLYNLEILLFKKNRDNINKKDREKLLCLFFGAGGVTRTRDLRITKQMKKYEIHSKQRKTAISFIP